eukprot:6194807-Pleurochrysis_carterae.AAC.1
MPTFKSNSLFIRAMAKFAALVKIPSRVSFSLQPEHREGIFICTLPCPRRLLFYFFLFPGCASPLRAANPCPSREAALSERASCSWPQATTFLEMTLNSARNGSDHVQPLRVHEADSFQLSACDIYQPDCSTTFSFSKSSKLKLFRGAPATIRDVSQALHA